MSAPLLRKTAVFLTATLSLFLLTFATLTFAAPNDIDDLFAVTQQTAVDPGPNANNAFTATLVDGKPALFFSTNNTLYYQPANDADGTTWAAPLPLAEGEIYFDATGFAIINGLPTLLFVDNDATTGRYQMMQATNSSGTAWSTPTVLPVDGYPRALTVVNGNPAFLYYRSLTPNRGLYYVRATDSSGSSWGTAVPVASGGRYFGGLSMTMVNGKPAVVYHDYDNRDVLYSQAIDGNGTSWGAPELLSADSNDFEGVLAVVDGRPALSFYDHDLQRNLAFMRANDADGNSWGSPVTVASGTYNVGKLHSLVFANGRPAIFFRDENDNTLNYVRASNSSGSSWGTPVPLTAEDRYTYEMMGLVANGRPAVGFYNEGGIKFLRADNANGTSWGAATQISGSYVGLYNSIEMVNGHPAISYMDGGNGKLFYVRATDAQGANWGEPLLIDENDFAGSESKLLVIDGKPAIAYLASDRTSNGLLRGGGADEGIVKFVQANDASGTSWGTPVTIYASTEYLYELDFMLLSGKPAVTFASGLSMARGAGASLFYFAAAEDTSGSSWDDPVLITGGSDVGIEEAAATVVNGIPMISYIFYDNSGSQPIWGVGYQRATSSSGESWTSRTMVYTGTSLIYPYDALAMENVNGHPAILFQEEDETNETLVARGGGVRIYQLEYVRAADALGDRWETAVPVVERINDSIDFIDLDFHNGTPLLAFSDESESTWLVRGLDTDGSAWGDELVVQTGSEWRDLSLTSSGDTIFLSSYVNNNNRLDLATIAPAVTLTADDMTIIEGDAGTTEVEITVTRSGSSTTAVSFDYGISGGTASADDFAGGTLPSGTVSFAAGETSQTITLAISGDEEVETDETIQLALSSSEAGSTFSTLTVTIENDDSDTVFIFLPFVVSD